MASIHPTGRKHKINIYFKREVSCQADDLCNGANMYLSTHGNVHTPGENIPSHIYLINLTDSLLFTLSSSGDPLEVESHPGLANCMPSPKKR